MTKRWTVLMWFGVFVGGSGILPAAQSMTSGELLRLVNQPPVTVAPYVVTGKPVVLDGFLLGTHAGKGGAFKILFSIPRLDPRSAAGKAGLKDGDQVIEIEGLPVEKMTMAEFHREWTTRRGVAKGMGKPVLLLVKSKGKKARPVMLEFQ